MATTASSTRRDVHEFTPDLLFGFFSTERDGRVPCHRASSSRRKPLRLGDLADPGPPRRGYPRRRSLHDALAELTLDPPISASDLAGPPRLDEDYLTISTIHAAKGLEWPIVHLPHLVDGALPSDMALGDPGGLAEEHRLFYVAVTRARDHLYLYAPQRLHYHRRGRDDQHGFGQLTRFLDAGALAACDSVTAAPLAPLLPAVGSLATKVDTALGALWDG
jgi:superfamily I DNA/RNA helicase